MQRTWERRLLWLRRVVMTLRLRIVCRVAAKYSPGNSAEGLRHCDVPLKAQRTLHSGNPPQHERFDFPLNKSGTGTFFPVPYSFASPTETTESSDLNVRVSAGNDRVTAPERLRHRTGTTASPHRNDRVTAPERPRHRTGTTASPHRKRRERRLNDLLVQNEIEPSGAIRLGNAENQTETRSGSPGVSPGRHRPLKMRRACAWSGASPALAQERRRLSPLEERRARPGFGEWTGGT